MFIILLLLIPLLSFSFQPSYITVKGKHILRWDDQYILHLINQESVLTDDLKKFKDYLIIHNDRVFPTSRYNSNAMRWSCMNGNCDAVKWLYDKKIHPHFSKDVMMYASYSGNIELMQWLYENISNDISNRAIYFASSEGNIEAVKWLVDKDKNTANSALLTATSSGHIEIVKWLVEENKTIITDKVITEAIINYHFNIANFLKENKSSNVLQTKN